MTDSTFTFPIISLEETDSTNQYLKGLCGEGEAEELTVVTAEYQQAGRGQQGNSWESERGKNLLFSFVLYPGMCANRQFILSQLVSLGIKDVLSEHCEGISIKWPNDIYWNDRKICGILIENVLNGSEVCRSIVGIGVNINQTTFVSDAPNPVSLKQVTGVDFDREQLLHDIMGNIASRYSRLRADAAYGELLRQEYAEALFRRTGYHTYADKQGMFRARVVDVLPDGCLILEDEQGTRRSYLFKEVQYILHPAS